MMQLSVLWFRCYASVVLVLVLWCWCYATFNGDDIVFFIQIRCYPCVNAVSVMLCWYKCGFVQMLAVFCRCWCCVGGVILVLNVF